MDRLPFIWRKAEAHRGSNLLTLSKFVKQFMLIDEIDGFKKYERHDAGRVSSSLIILPGSSFYRNNQTYRSDIKWMWNHIRGDDGRIEIGPAGALSLFHTEEPTYYHPSRNVDVGDWAEPTLMWKWIQYVVWFSWFKQKRGKLREFFGGEVETKKMLKMVSEALILRDS